ncbi:hypothetical protein AAMO2058_001554200 [Amorphochlora amoebiformis]
MATIDRVSSPGTRARAAMFEKISGSTPRPKKPRKFRPAEWVWEWICFILNPFAVGRYILGKVIELIVALTIAVRFLYVSMFGLPGTGGVQPIAQIVEDEGYHVSTHLIRTRDGYKLVAFRIRARRRELAARVSVSAITGDAAEAAKNKDLNKNKASGTVLLWHGLLDDAFTWVAQGKRRSLAYLLADQGFDVWLGNNRGNCYGQSHDYLNPNDCEFWNFSWDEMIKFDLPDTITYIQNTLKEEGKVGPNGEGVKLSYVGHSEGTTQMFGLLSDHPKLASKLCSFVALGPVGKVGNISSTALTTLANWNLDKLVWWMGFRSSFMMLQGSSEHLFISFAAYIAPSLVDMIITLLCGPSNSPMSSPEQRKTWGSHEPGGTSILNVAHWCQSIRQKSFQKYDYGEKLNKKRYGRPRPPMYDVENIPKKLPKLLVRGTKDALVGAKDFEWLVSQLSSRSSMKDGLSVVQLPNWNHTDYLWDKNAHIEVYPHVMEFLKEHQQWHHVHQSEIKMSGSLRPESKKRKGSTRPAGDRS